MKQQITKEQWNELTEDEGVKYLSTVHREPMPDFLQYITIGQLIEFLDAGDVERDEDGIAKDREAGDFEEIYGHWRINNNEVNFYWKGELIDALWEATKYKLKNN